MKSGKLMIVRTIQMKELHNRICVNLGRMGFTAKYISQRTGMTVNQVRSRLRKASVYLWDYRNGLTDIAVVVASGTEKATQKRLLEMHIKLKPLLKE